MKAVAVFPGKRAVNIIDHLGTFIERWPDALGSLITARFPLSRACEPLSDHAGGIKNVVQIAS